MDGSVFFEGGFDAILVWFDSSLRGHAQHTVMHSVAWHGRLMVLAWSVLLPIGVMVARYFKTIPGQDWPRELDHQFWWHTHRVLQWTGIAVMLIGVVIVWLENMDSASKVTAAHGLFGWLVVALGLLQVIGGLLRGTKGGPRDASESIIDCGDHYNMTHRRRIFEWAHKVVGYVVLLLAWFTSMLGLWLADAPRWMAACLCLWWVILIAAFMVLQRKRGCMDTYQAIWGAEPHHPGNALRPIGWGIHRQNNT